ncbi:alanine--tRNA ligase [Sansalvadorimonas sp. 2012CJ34-2]|uniref:Alanine--tRNA ligase n=1 Tax=Parendozoicomonas callyspongiae TaxID=2942213 RepID=A0ABT0PI52_9GAMM|nr:alanine--tRNA ligase [Sansalvadorimonas sp. 2012CJ34-2]MCL6271067.1 alanine--tRNA ligase [Sansalvadorimonas sp. 2012CJ34-2]
MKSSELRSAFQKYFEEQGHTAVASGSLVPHDDPTLLFTNAGMNQFKDVFLGREARDYTRATTAQRCVRAGGKHNDLENVGYTARHHTFFEMLGNFSFGDYFKRDAIKFAWNFLTGTLGIPEEKLWVTVYKDDKEAEDIWLKEMGVPADRFSRLGEKDNFWSMGDTGPCGPCSEIFYDHGEDIAGDPPGGPNDDGDRYIEIWNMVFMQFNRTADGEMHPLPKPSIDTGMGLERIAAVVQGVHNNYDIDLFQHILGEAGKLLGGVDSSNNSLRVIADHIRSSAFLVADGVLPSNDGRGYTLRRIIRRACRHGHKLGATGSFFYKLVPALVEAMGDAAQIVADNKDQVMDILKKEEEQFARTLDKGMKILEDDIADLKGTVIPGKTVFTLYDTYGFPVDLTNDIARERGLTIDEDSYEACMEEQRQRARAASQFGVDYNSAITVEGETEFTGYTNLVDEDTVKALFVEGEAVNAVTAGTKAVVVLNKTPFYAESGGQAGDTGILETANGEFRVLDTKKESGNHLHTGEVVSGSLKIGEKISAEIDADKRVDSARNHSATHLAHEALRRVLGGHVQQKGSLVDSDKLRFDFSHGEAMTEAQIKEVEQIVNTQVRANSAVNTEVTDMDTAHERGATMLFGEKYGDTVRVLSMGTDRFSVELCGGTHVERTGDIGQFVITSEGGIAAGVRRIEALTGQAAQDWLAENDRRLLEVGSLVKGNRETAADKVKALVARNRDLEKEIQQLKQKLASAAGADMASSAVEVAGVKLLSTKLEGVDPKSLRDMVDQLKNKLGSGVIMLATEAGGKISLAAGVTKDLTGKVKAGDLLKMVAEQVGGRGGGRPDFAQGGGSDAAALPSALASVEKWLGDKLS